MKTFSFLKMLLVAAVFAPSLSFGSELSIAVMEFSSKGGVAVKKTEALSDLLANQIRAMGKYKVIGKSDIKAALDLEQQKSVMGCSSDSCIAEIGGALGVQWVVVGNVSLFGKTYLLNLKVLDVANVKVIAGVSKKVGGGEDMLIDAMGVAARELIAQAEKNSGAASGTTSSGADADSSSSVVEKSLSVENHPPQKPSNKLKMWGHITFWSGLGVFAAGLISTGIAADRAKVYQDSNENQTTRLDAMKASEVAGAVGTVGSIVGGIFMVAGVVLWIVAPSDEELSAVPAVSIIGDGDSGAVFGLVGRW